MNKQAIYTYSGMNQDISNSKFDNTFYFEGMNIRVLSTNNQSSGSITNTKGNEFLLEIPIPVINYSLKTITYNSTILNYNNDEINSVSNSNDKQIIIGNCRTKNGFVIFTTNNKGLDCIWFLDENTLIIKLLYLRNLNFNTSSPIQCLNNYENNLIDKIYWVDGKEQLRVLNINHSIDNGDLENLIDIYMTSLNIISDINFSEIKIEEISYGGKHTSGMIQYGYSYYKLNGSESLISPISNLIPLGKSSVEGGNINEVVGTIPKIVIDNLDNRFTNLKIYAIKYTSFNELPSVSVIVDRNISGLNNFIYYDDGNILYDSSLEIIALNNSNFIIPKHIESKNNRLFSFNYKNKLFKLNQIKNNLDCRAYSFPINSLNTKVYKNIVDYDENTDITTGDFDTITYANNIQLPNFLEYNHASINGNYKINKYQPNSNILGGEGYYLKYELIRTNENKNDIYDYRFFKDNELYRIAIQFYNKYGIKSTPNWIADFVVTSDNNDCNLNGNYAGINIYLKNEFFIWLNDSSNFLDENGNYDDFYKPVGFKLLRAERNESDKTIKDQGIINGMICSSSEKGYTNLETDILRANSAVKMPSLMRRFDNYLCPMFGNLSYARLDNQINHPRLGYGSGSGSPGSEAYSFVLDPYVDGDGDRDRASKSSSYQFNKLMQFYSPEILFNKKNTLQSTKCKVIGGIVNNRNDLKIRSENWNTALFSGFQIYPNVISPFDINSPALSQDYNSYISGSMLFGLYGPSYLSDTDQRQKVSTYQFNREYVGNFIKNNNNNIYKIYGKPEIVESDQKATKYNNNSELTYINNLNLLNTNEAGHDDKSNTLPTRINSVLSKGSRSGIFALGEDDTLTKDRLDIESLFYESSIEDDLDNINIYEPSRNPLYKIVNTISDITFDFSNLYVGVLDTSEVFFNNDIVNSVTFFNSQNVELIFDDSSDFDYRTITLGENYDNKRIAFADAIDTNYYLVNDSSLGIAGTTVIDNTFNYLIPLDTTEVNRYVDNLDELYGLNTYTLNIGYRVGVKNINEIYEFNGNTSLSTNLQWDYYLDLPFTVSTAYKGGVGLILEFINDEKLKYIGSYYGGNSYEAKTKTVYVEASKYFNINTSPSYYIIPDPGDVFVQEYSILRICKNENIPINSTLLRMSEIVKVRLESTINQDKRNDLSKDEFNSIWQPSQGDYHSYNNVYSQSSNLLKSIDTSFEVKNIENYETNIISSEFKRPNEVIDNWTKFNVNNTITLEGKYGAINSVVKHNDEIITFQDNAICQISINPRTMIQGSDGINIKLGTGDVLDRYQYINTNSGTLNKWGVISCNTGIYYYDTINNTINLIGQNNKITDFKHLHSFFQKNINNNIIKLDNHILKTGIQLGYDYLNNDIYFTFLQNNNSKTINFNELKNEFISLHSFKPSFYFNKGNLFLTTNNNNYQIYSHKEGIYNKYYDIYEPSYIIYNLNPNPLKECIFNNINFKSEVYLNNIDQFDKTITHIQCYNEYQDSGLIPLIFNRDSNIRRKFRDWNAFIPRQGRNRIRGPYCKLKLQFNNDNNLKLILHDLILNYTE